MPLPVLHTHGEVGTEDLVRLYHRTELHFARHLGEELALDVGTAIANRDLPNVCLANRVLEAALPDGTSPEQAVAAVDEAFSRQGARCRQWVMNPAATPARTAPLVRYLISAGCSVEAKDILCLAGAASWAAGEAPRLTIIPARASFRHARQLADESARWDGEPQLADAAMLHLDDPHWDALLAMRDGAAVGYAGVLAVGDIGRIDQVYVAQGCRHQGIGRTILGRALEVCARSRFRHVMLAVAPENEPAQALSRQVGFRKIGQMAAYQRP
jgi:ribosomal protein S18 acetylase RimI-like enzyme